MRRVYTCISLSSLASIKYVRPNFYYYLVSETVIDVFQFASYARADAEAFLHLTAAIIDVGNE